MYSVQVRRLINLFLATLPFALLHRLDDERLVPLITMLIVYLLVALDHIGGELENPFAVDNLSHLSLDRISATIERNTLALFSASPGGLSPPRGEFGRP